MKKILTMVLALLATMATMFAEPKKLAVATFDITNNAVTDLEADGITELYISELVGTGSVTVVDRTNFDKLIKEMKFQAGDWSDKEKTVELGNAVNAQLIARGQIIKLGSKLYLSATVIDVKTAAILSSARRQFNTLDDVFDLLAQFSRDIVDGLRPKIGDKGAGGGIVFKIEGHIMYECSEVLGNTDRDTAITMCKEYRGGGFDDWHLPTRAELGFIFQNLYATGIISDNAGYWSSTSNNNEACVVYLDDGRDRYYYFEKSYTFCVRAVRAFSN